MARGVGVFRPLGFLILIAPEEPKIELCVI